MTLTRTFETPDVATVAAIDTAILPRPEETLRVLRELVATDAFTSAQLQQLHRVVSATALDLNSPIVSRLRSALTQALDLGPVVLFFVPDWIKSVHIETLADRLFRKNVVVVDSESKAPPVGLNPEKCELMIITGLEVFDDATTQPSIKRWLDLWETHSKNSNRSTCHLLICVPEGKSEAIPAYIMGMKPCHMTPSSFRGICASHEAVTRLNLSLLLPPHRVTEDAVERLFADGPQSAEILARDLVGAALDLPLGRTVIRAEDIAERSTVHTRGLKATVDDFARKKIIETLIANDWSRTKSAKVLGVSRVTLYKKIKRLGIQLPESESAE